MTYYPLIQEQKQQKTYKQIIMKMNNKERLEENEYQYQQRMGYEMAINEIKPLLQDILKVLDKGNSTRNKIDGFFKENPKSTWANAKLQLGLSSNNLISFHLPKIKLINRIKSYISNCCQASIIEETDICSKCKEHCEPEILI